MNKVVIHFMCINVETTNVNTEHTYITILQKITLDR